MLIRELTYSAGTKPEPLTTKRDQVFSIDGDKFMVLFSEVKPLLD
jgi:hypothetical protein